MAVVYATIKNRITHVPDDVELICNNPTDVIEIEFDEEWSEKTGYVARFEWNGKYYDVPFEGNRVKVPELSNTTWIMFGVYADNITSAPVKVKCKKSILCYGGSERQVPANPFYDEFVERLENVEEAVKHGGGVTPEQIGQAVEDYLTKNPVEFAEEDPTVPAWAKEANKPKYTADEVGAQPKGNYALKDEIPVEGVQELLWTIETTGEAKIIIDELEGAPLNLTYLHIAVNSENSEAAQIQVEVTGMPNGYIGALTMSTTDSGKYVGSEFYQKKGWWTNTRFASGSKFGYGATYEAGEEYRHTVNVATTPCIGKIVLKNIKQTTGTIIEVWGVRA